MVLLDVVYNHFGPDGNYLPVYAPQFFTDRHKTPWGAAINFDGPRSRAVRDFVIHNALYWVEQYHMDGLRLDAVHAILDDSPVHILEELAARLRQAAGNRRIHLVLENEKNEARWLERNMAGRPALYTAQWNDDVHHVLHTAVTGEDQGYYGEYCGDTEKLGRALAEGFAFQGEMMGYRKAPRGEPSTHLPTTAFVAFLQNHDQIGNRAFGDRIAAIATAGALRAVNAVYLLLPQIPMLFMGEEWGTSQPFPFFCDFGRELAEAVRQGRREEFSRFPEFQDPARREKIPDPQSQQTFEAGKLRWEELNDPVHREWLDWYWKILVTRREAIVPLLEQMKHGGKHEVVGAGAVVVRWQCGASGDLVLAANLSGVTVTGFPPVSSSLLWQEGNFEDGGRTLHSWTVLWSMNASGKHQPDSHASGSVASPNHRAGRVGERSGPSELVPATGAPA
jgi:malto-oligosyltrehalose trehalohydrolase